MSGNRNLATKFAESVLKIRDTTINNSADFQANGLEKNCFDINKVRLKANWVDFFFNYLFACV